MKTNILYKSITLLFLVFSLPTFGQHNPKIKALKISYITTELNLTPKEAQAFWPIYNTYDTELRLLHKKLNTAFIKPSTSVNNTEFSEKEAQQVLKNAQNLELKLAKTKNKMQLELLKVISAKKILKLHQAEHNFKRKMLREYGKRRRGR